jgi:hypothetical protein
MVQKCGFAEVGSYAAVSGTVDPTEGGLVVLVARKGGCVQ